MPAYVMALIDVTNPEGYKEYAAMSPAAIAQYGGKYLARAGRSEVLEGEQGANRLVILEFESYDRALEWWNSPEYEAAKPYRRANANSTMLLVEGVPEGTALP